MEQHSTPNRGRTGSRQGRGSLLLGSAVATAALAATVLTGVSAPASSAVTSFTNTPLFATTQLPSGVTTAPRQNASGDSEPAIAFGSDGAMAAGGLSWLSSATNLWRGSFGSTPAYFGAMDANVDVPGAGRTATGGHDEDLEITTAGTLLLADLTFIGNPTQSGQKWGVNVTRCPQGATGPSSCQQILLDTAGADRQWITSDGTTVWVAYHDSQSSTLIRVKRSTDDGITWADVGSPIPGQGAATGDATFNNDIGPIAADPTTGTVYASYIAGEANTKASSIIHNNVYVSRSRDGGRRWTSTLVFHAPPGTQLANFFPALALDPVTHRVYVAWSTETHGVSIASSSDGGVTWTTPKVVSTATTTVMPSVAARGDKVDVVYYGSQAASIDDPAAVWNVYDSQRRAGTWTVKQVSKTPNRVGKVCLDGSACTGNRELLDLFEVAEDPATGKAAVVYTDTTLSTWTSADGTTRQLPEIVLAYER